MKRPQNHSRFRGFLSRYNQNGYLIICTFDLLKLLLSLNNPLQCIGSSHQSVASKYWWAKCHFTTLIQHTLLNNPASKYNLDNRPTFSPSTSGHRQWKMTGAIEINTWSLLLIFPYLITFLLYWKHHFQWLSKPKRHHCIFEDGATRTSNQIYFSTTTLPCYPVS